MIKSSLDFGTTRKLIQTAQRFGYDLKRYEGEGSHLNYALKRINVMRGESNPRASFFHEYGHLLDDVHGNLRPSSAINLRTLQSERSANKNALSRIMKPEHKELYKKEMAPSYSSYRNGYIYSKMNKANKDMNLKAIGERITSKVEDAPQIDANKLVDKAFKKLVPGFELQKQKFSRQHMEHLKRSPWEP